MFGGSEEDMLGGIDITQEMVTKQLSRLRDDKASGPDELIPRFLNEIREGIVQPLTLLFRKVVEETEVPEDWKQANVTVLTRGRSRGQT